MGGACNTREVNDEYKMLIENPEAKQLWNVGVNWKIILQWILSKYGVKVWLDLTSSGQGHMEAFVNTVMNRRVQ
jgi:hypothetical protein